MTQPRISYNVHADAPNFNREYLYAQLDGYNPTWLLIMNATRLAIETARRYPQTQVIARSYAPADDNPLKVYGTWANFLAHVKQDLKSNLKLDETLPPNLWIYANNESGDSNELHSYLTGLISQPELKFVIGNYSAGTPKDTRWKDLLPFLRLVSDNRHRIVLGAHEYFCGIPTSGQIGGAPNHPAHADFTKRENWIAPFLDTKFHCGRFNFLLATCKEHGIKPPRLLITEHGSDSMDDIADWAQSLPKTPPYQNNRGWRSWWNAWRTMYGANLDVERFYADCLIYADEAYYANSPVEGQLVYSLFSSEQWRQFDIAYTGIPQMLRDYAGTTPTPPPVELPDDPLPQPDFKAYIRAALADTMDNLRTAKEQLASAVDTLNRLEEMVETEL